MIMQRIPLNSLRFLFICYSLVVQLKAVRMSTFAVDDVQRATDPLPVAPNPLEVIGNKIQVKPESCSKFPDNLNPVGQGSTLNSLVGAVQVAYSEHYPLVLSPDIIWQCVAQGFAIHVNKNAEKLRHMFVAHQGKKKIVVEVNDFIKGSPDNDWGRALGDFSEAIRKNVGDEIHSLLTPDFTTTGPVERAAAQAVLMNTFKEYFDYTARTMCGIPAVTLEGTVDDWKKLRDKTLSLSRFDFEWWTEAVKPVLDEFVEASSGNVNKSFWQSLYKISGGSGGPYITGWILTLFPYLGCSIDGMRPNSYLQAWERIEFFGPTTSDFPKGSVSTPFTWEYHNLEFEMYFYAGFLGVGQDKKTLALKPVIGWAVVDKEEEEKAKMERREEHLMW